MITDDNIANLTFSEECFAFENTICIWHWLECEMKGECWIQTRDEITHLAQKPIPYALSRTIQVFKHFRILFYGTFYDTYTEKCLSQYWCQNGERHQECEKLKYTNI